MKRFLFGRVWLMMIALLLANFTQAWAQLDSGGKLVEGAKKEGQLLLYTSMSVGDHTKYVELFNNRYPFIQVNVRRAGSDRLLTLITTEHRAGKTLFDVVMGSGFGLSFVRSGIFAKYLSPETRHLAEGTKDPEGYWADTYVNGIGVTYNTRMVPKDKIPRRWEDLLDPLWKGRKIAIDNEPYEWFDAVLRVMGKEKGREFMRRLGEQELAVQRGYTIRAQQLAAGEFALCLCYVHQVDRLRKQGAPVDWPKNEQLFIVNVLHPILIAAKAEHPNAARLFYDYTLSKEGQQLMVQLGRIGSSRLDVETEVPKIVRFVPEDLSVYDRMREIRAESESLLRIK
jgi:iron(III) transport system substrate-binding protein